MLYGELGYEELEWNANEWREYLEPRLLVVVLVG